MERQAKTQKGITGKLRSKRTERELGDKEEERDMKEKKLQP